MSIEVLVFQLLNGLVWGLILALMALGLSLIYGLLKVVNVAHGSLYMLGAVLSWYVIRFTGNFWVAMLVAPIIVGLLGVVIERAIVRRLSDSDVLSIIATIGLMFVIEFSTLAIFGGELQRIEVPIAGTVPIIGMLHYSIYRIFAASMAVLVLVLLWLALNKSKFGRWVRAVKQDKDMASALGIPAQFVYAVTFGAGAGLAALAGVLAAPIVIVEYTMGMNILVTAFIVVIIGGLGSLMGTALSAILVGVFTGLLASAFNPTIATVIMLLLMMVVVLIRPSGLFAK